KLAGVQRCIQSASPRIATVAPDHVHGPNRLRGMGSAPRDVDHRYSRWHGLPSSNSPAPWYMTTAVEVKARLHSVNRFACCAMTRCHARNAFYRGRPPGTLALRLRALRCASRSSASWATQAGLMSVKQKLV